MNTMSVCLAGKSGVVLRAGVEKSSPLVRELPRDTLLCAAPPAVPAADGTARVKIVVHVIRRALQPCCQC